MKKIFKRSFAGGWKLENGVRKIMRIEMEMEKHKIRMLNRKEGKKMNLKDCKMRIKIIITIKTVTLMMITPVMKMMLKRVKVKKMMEKNFMNWNYSHKYSKSGLTTHFTRMKKKAVLEMMKTRKNMKMMMKNLLLKNIRVWNDLIIGRIHR